MAVEAFDPAFSRVVSVPMRAVASKAVVTEATPDYSTGDAFGVIMTMTDFFRRHGGSANLKSIQVLAAIANTVALDFLFLNAALTTSTWTNNAAVAVTAADFDKIIGVKQVTATTGWFALGTPSMGLVECNVPLVAAAASRDLYVGIIARGTINCGATDDFRFVLNAEHS